MKNLVFTILNFRFFLVFYFVFSAASAHQKNNLKLITESLTISKNKIEKDNLYLQTNKGIYETGEDLWFKGYILDAKTLLPSLQSETLFLTLTNSKTNKVVWKEKYYNENGFINGHIYIQDTLSTGDYFLEAFTSNSIFKNTIERNSIRKLRIVQKITADKYILKKKRNNKKKKIVYKKDTVYKKEIIQFSLFPEGGYLVNNLESKVGFKAVDQNGLPIEISGILYENKTKLKTVKTAHAGMGFFIIKPKKDRQYFIILDSFPNKKYFLKEIKTKGKVLRFISANEKVLRVNISQSETENKETIYLRLQQKGITYNLIQVELRDKINVEIPVEKLPQGIAEITLFNNYLQPIAERLVYINPHKKLKITTKLNKDRFRTKEKVTLNIKVTDQNDEPQIAHLGISVFDKLYINNNDAKNIITHYQLSTQLKGNIYDPQHYFNPKNPNKAKKLDLLLLTQGWRKYIWNEQVLDKFNYNNKLILKDTILGRATFRGKPFKGVKKNKLIDAPKSLMSFTANQNDNKGFFEIDTLGNFSIPPRYLITLKKSYVYFKLLPDLENKKYLLHLSDNRFKQIENIQEKSIFYPIANTKLHKQNIVKPFRVFDDNMLDEILIKTKKKKIFRDKFLGSLDSIMKLGTGYICKNRILNCLAHPPPSIGTIYLFNGNYSEEELLYIFNIAAIKGYYPKREFYNPIYDKEDLKFDVPDFRNTLFWKPDLITNEKGETSVTFFTSDLDTPFVGFIEGLGLNSLLGTSEFEFYVTKQK